MSALPLIQVKWNSKKMSLWRKVPLLSLLRSYLETLMPTVTKYGVSRVDRMMACALSFIDFTRRWSMVH